MIEQYQKHIDQLAAELNVRQLEWPEAMIRYLLTGNFLGITHPDSFQGKDTDNPENGYVIFIAEPEGISDEQNYFSGLHELGHTALKHSEHDKSQLTHAQITDMEQEAWEWALEHADHWPSDSAMIWILASFSTYTDYGVQEERQRAFELPELPPGPVPNPFDNA